MEDDGWFRNFIVAWAAYSFLHTLASVSISSGKHCAHLCFSDKTHFSLLEIWHSSNFFYHIVHYHIVLQNILLYHIFSCRTILYNVWSYVLCHMTIFYGLIYLCFVWYCISYHNFLCNIYVSRALSLYFIKFILYHIIINLLLLPLLSFVSENYFHFSTRWGTWESTEMWI